MLTSQQRNVLLPVSCSVLFVLFDALYCHSSCRLRRQCDCFAILSLDQSKASESLCRALYRPSWAAVLALLLASDIAPPVAFITIGVVGPLVGADLLHLSDLEVNPIGIVSVGGAGTFDGVVLSGIVAAYLA